MAAPAVKGFTHTSLSVSDLDAFGDLPSVVVYAAMPDVFAPYWCVQVEPVRHERRWPINLFAYPIMKRRG
jgi:hypothetical protein